jgi:hypothetical protein
MTLAITTAIRLSRFLQEARADYGDAFLLPRQKELGVQAVILTLRNVILYVLSPHIWLLPYPQHAAVRCVPHRHRVWSHITARGLTPQTSQRTRTFIIKFAPYPYQHVGYPRLLKRCTSPAVHFVGCGWGCSLSAVFLELLRNFYLI